MGNKTLDLGKVSVRPFGDETQSRNFRCGERNVDKFLRDKAAKSVDRHEYRVFCAHIVDDPEVIGYYTLQVGADKTSDLPKVRRRSYLGKYQAFPAIYMGWLGVRSDYQGQGLGKYLLMDVFQKVAEVSKYVGLYALTLRSLNEVTTRFYESLGFWSYSTEAKQPKMLYPIQDIIYLVNRTDI
mgnify:CR=1 FL=1